MEVLSDAMYSDSQLVMEAVAELMERVLETRDMTMDRMTQTRYIMEVDETTFQSISVEDLQRIESKEMNAIEQELVSAIGLQRFRFAERQTNGEFILNERSLYLFASLWENAQPSLVLLQTTFHR